MRRFLTTGAARIGSWSCERPVPRRDESFSLGECRPRCARKDDNRLVSAFIPSRF
jgi:hypothetical protein